MDEDWPKAIIAVSDLFKSILKPHGIRSEAEAKRYADLVDAQTRLEVAKIEKKIEEIQNNNRAEILEKAKGYTKQDVESSDIDPVWIMNFFDECKNINDEQMQEIFASILAGEVDNPGSYSTRTLNVLKMLESNEAESFSQLLQYAVSTGGKTVIATVIMPLEVSYLTLMTLEEAGLIKLNENQFVMKPDDGIFNIIYGSLIGVIEGEPGNEVQLGSIACLTIVGEELYRLGKKNKWFEYDDNFFKKYIKSLETEKRKVSVHKIVDDTNNGKITYESRNIL